MMALFRAPLLVGMKSTDQIILGQPGQARPGAIARASVGAVTGGALRYDCLSSRRGLAIRRRGAFAFQAREIGRKIAGVFILDPLSHGTHHGIVACAGPVCFHGVGEIDRILACKAGAGEIVAHAAGAVTDRASISLGLAGECIAGWRRGFSKYQIECWRMRIVTNGTLLRPGVIGDHDLRLLLQVSRSSAHGKGCRAFSCPLGQTS